MRLDVPVQLFLPPYAPDSVSMTLRAHFDARGLVVVGHAVEVTATEEVLALGCSSPLAAEDGLAEAETVLRYLWGMLPSIVDAPPF